MNPNPTPASIRVDVNLNSIYGVDDGQWHPIDNLDLTGNDVTGDATALKVSHSKKITGAALKIPQGNETACDVDCSEDVHLEGDFGLPCSVGQVQGDNVLRFKGGDRNCSASGRLHSRGKRWGVDIEIGDWMDQSYAMTRGTDLEGILPHADGKKWNYVAIGWAVPFTTKMGPYCRYLFWASMALKGYVILKFIARCPWGWRGHGVPRGTKGPAWLP